MNRPLKSPALCEIAPFAKTGGVADVVPRATQGLACARTRCAGRHAALWPDRSGAFQFAAGGRAFSGAARRIFQAASILVGKLDDSEVQAYFVDNPELFNAKDLHVSRRRRALYLLFARGARDAQGLNWQPDVIHCHDWHTALVPNWLRTIYASDRFSPIRRPSIHSTISATKASLVIGYSKSQASPLMDLSPTRARHPNQPSPDFMARGILFADEVNTVSETYAREIQSAEFGEKLEPILRERKDLSRASLMGSTSASMIRHDAALARTFDHASLDARATNKFALQMDAGLSCGPTYPSWRWSPG